MLAGNALKHLLGRGDGLLRHPLDALNPVSSLPNLDGHFTGRFAIDTQQPRRRRIATHAQDKRSVREHTDRPVIPGDARARRYAAPQQSALKRIAIKPTAICRPKRFGADSDGATNQ
jgi:hypothetical protein